MKNLINKHMMHFILIGASIFGLEVLAHVDFCPKYHFPSNSSCFMYYLGNKTMISSLEICKNFSGNLIFLNSDYRKWDYLVSQLKNFNLDAYNFKMQFDFKYSANSSNLNNDLRFCQNQNSNTKDLKCNSVKKYEGSWCIDFISCEDESPFICEWKIDTKRNNAKLGSLLSNVFLCFTLFSLLYLILIVLLLVYFYLFQKNYLDNYIKQLEIAHLQKIDN